MELTFTNICFHTQEEKDIFNLHAVQSIKLDFDTNICTMQCACGEFVSPFCEFRYGGGIDHFSFVVRHPYENSFLEITIFNSGGNVRVFAASRIPDYFKNKCKHFLFNPKN